MSRRYLLQPKIDQWVVKKDDLSALFTLFLKRFSNSSNTKIVLSFDHESEDFFKFEQFEKCVQKELLASKRQLKTIKFTGFKTGISASSIKSAELTIYFEFDSINVLIMGTGGSEIGDWVQGFNSDLETLFRSFKPDEKTINYIKNANEERYKYRASVIFFDYNNQLGNIVSQNETEGKFLIKDSQVHFGNGDNVIGDKTHSVSKRKNESLTEKLFWQVIVALIVGVIGASIVRWLGFT